MNKQTICKLRKEWFGDIEARKKHPLDVNAQHTLKFDIIDGMQENVLFRNIYAFDINSQYL